MLLLHALPCTPVHLPSSLNQPYRRNFWHEAVAHVAHAVRLAHVLSLARFAVAISLLWWNYDKGETHS